MACNAHSSDSTPTFCTSHVNRCDAYSGQVAARNIRSIFPTINLVEDDENPIDRLSELTNFVDQLNLEALRRGNSPLNINLSGIIRADVWRNIRNKFVEVIRPYRDTHQIPSYATDTIIAPNEPITNEAHFSLIKDLIEDVNECFCFCNYSCTCNCNYSCTCNCNYCTCNCNYCTCNCNYCTCNCNYCTCNVDACPCNCNVCTCDCNYTSCNCQCNYCTCQCDYCACDCNNCVCNCNYCTCNCNYCTCNCNYCTCDCNYCTCNCNYACTCDCNYCTCNCNYDVSV